jgi:uncharacterized protein YndB with AHSA1/START domain
MGLRKNSRRLVCEFDTRRSITAREEHCRFVSTCDRLTATHPVGNTTMTASTQPVGTEFIITRTFEAPREVVWKAWTERERLMRWFGPKGVTIAKADLDLRPGGVFHYCMETPDGHEMWGKWTFLEITPPDRLIVIVSFSDANQGITRHPMSATWPLETLSKTTFTEHDGRTTLEIRWSVYNGTAEEQATFDGAHDGMKQGWTGTLDQLEEYLAAAK